MLATLALESVMSHLSHGISFPQERRLSRAEIFHFVEQACFQVYAPRGGELFPSAKVTMTLHYSEPSVVCTELTIEVTSKKVEYQHILQTFRVITPTSLVCEGTCKYLANTSQQELYSITLGELHSLEKTSVKAICPVCSYLQLFDTINTDVHDIHCTNCQVQLDLVQADPLEFTWRPKDGHWRE